MNVSGDEVIENVTNTNTTKDKKDQQTTAEHQFTDSDDNFSSSSSLYGIAVLMRLIINKQPSSLLEAVSEVELVENAVVLLEGDREAVEHVVNVCLGEQGGVSELSLEGVEVVVVLDGLDDVAELHALEGLLGEDGVEIVHGDQEVVQVALTLLKGGGVAEGTLVVGNGPLGGAHHSQVVVAVGVDRTKESVLGGEALVCNYIPFN